MNESLIKAVEVLAVRGDRIRDSWRLPWPRHVDSAVQRLRLNHSGARVPAIAAIVGGASSGKSTIFNNLLEGRSTSHITAKGHSTRGLILAVHTDWQENAQSQLAERRLFSNGKHHQIELDANQCGEPDVVCVVEHRFDHLRDVWLVDTPDFTSAAAEQEGQVTLSQLAWFDALIVVLDEERWFDRQMISRLREHSTACGQQRFVVFNRTQPELSPEALVLVKQQAERLDAVGHLILEQRAGRGLCRFPPASLQTLVEFVQGISVDRSARLLQMTAEAAREVANQNDERRHRLAELERSLQLAVERQIPARHDCMMSLMTPDERRQLEVVWRVLRASGVGEWVGTKARRIGEFVRSIPMLGVGAKSAESSLDAMKNTPTRNELAKSFATATLQRMVADCRRAAGTSRFWDEIHSWTGLKPTPAEMVLSQPDADAIADVALRFDRALTEWSKKVEAECSELSTNVKAGASVAVIGLALVLIAVPGPVTALTAVAAHGAIAAAIGKLAAATGAAALFGRHLGRFGEVIRERLLGSSQLGAVQEAAESMRSLIASMGRTQAEISLRDANALVVPDDSVEWLAIEALRDAAME